MSIHKAMACLSLLLITQISPVYADENSGPDKNVFAIVNGQSITYRDYLSALNEGMRKRFYHGKAPEKQLQAYKQELTDELINNMLLLQEAKRRHIQPDATAVTAQIENYEKRYAGSEQWQQRRGELLPSLRTELEDQSLLQRIQSELKIVKGVSEGAVKDYYQRNQDKFTMPERRKVSLILIKVDPSSDQTVWKSTQDEAQLLIDQIKGGADFAELAKIHSGDGQSSGKGGNMGYLHKGMLASEAEATLDKMSPGEISEPITLLEGVAIIRLDDISRPVVTPFESARQRAHDLLIRELSELQYKKTLFELRNSAEIRIVNSTSNE